MKNFHILKAEAIGVRGYRAHPCIVVETNHGSFFIRIHNRNTISVENMTTSAQDCRDSGKNGQRSYTQQYITVRNVEYNVSVTAELDDSADAPENIKLLYKNFSRSGWNKNVSASASAGLCSMVIGVVTLIMRKFRHERNLAEVLEQYYKAESANEKIADLEKQKAELKMVANLHHNNMADFLGKLPHEYQSVFNDIKTREQDGN